MPTYQTKYIFEIIIAGEQAADTLHKWTQMIQQFYTAERGGVEALTGRVEQLNAAAKNLTRAFRTALDPMVKQFKELGDVIKMYDNLIAKNKALFNFITGGRAGAAGGAGVTGGLSYSQVYEILTKISREFREQEEHTTKMAADQEYAAMKAGLHADEEKRVADEAERASAAVKDTKEGLDAAVTSSKLLAEELRKASDTLLAAIEAGKLPAGVARELGYTPQQIEAARAGAEARGEFGKRVLPSYQATAKFLGMDPKDLYAIFTVMEDVRARQREVAQKQLSAEDLKEKAAEAESTAATETVKQSQERFKNAAYLGRQQKTTQDKETEAATAARAAASKQLETAAEQTAQVTRRSGVTQQEGRVLTERQRLATFELQVLRERLAELRRARGWTAATGMRMGGRIRTAAGVTTYPGPEELQVLQQIRSMEARIAGLAAENQRSRLMYELTMKTRIPTPQQAIAWARERYPPEELARMLGTGYALIRPEEFRLGRRGPFWQPPRPDILRWGRELEGLPPEAYGRREVQREYLRGRYPGALGAAGLPPLVDFDPRQVVLAEEKTQLLGKALSQAINQASIATFGWRRMGFQLDYLGRTMTRVGQQMLGSLEELAQGYLGLNEAATMAAMAMGLGVDMQDDLEMALLETSAALGLLSPEEMAAGVRLWAAGTGEVVQTEEDLNRMLERTVVLQKLASMSNTEFGTVIKITGGIMKGFNLNLEQTGEVAKLLNYVAATTFATVEDIGQAMSYAAPMAHQLGVGMDELAIVIGMVSDVNIRGTRVGRALTQMFLQATDATAAHNEAMNKALAPVLELGQTWDDIVFPEGKFVGMAKYVDILAASVESLNDHQRAQLLGQIAVATEMPVITTLVESQVEARKYGINIIQAELKLKDKIIDGEVRRLLAWKETNEGIVASTEGAFTMFERMWTYYEMQDFARAKRLQQRWSAVLKILGKLVYEQAEPLLTLLEKSLDLVTRMLEAYPDWARRAIAAVAVGGGIATVLGTAITAAGQLIGAWTALKTIQIAGAEFAKAALLFKTAVDADVIARATGVPAARILLPPGVRMPAAVAPVAAERARGALGGAAIARAARDTALAAYTTTKAAASVQAGALLAAKGFVGAGTAAGTAATALTAALPALLLLSSIPAVIDYAKRQDIRGFLAAQPEEVQRAFLDMFMMLPGGRGFAPRVGMGRPGMPFAPVVSVEGARLIAGARPEDPFAGLYGTVQELPFVLARIRDRIGESTQGVEGTLSAAELLLDAFEDSERAEADVVTQTERAAELEKLMKNEAGLTRDQLLSQITALLEINELEDRRLRLAEARARVGRGVQEFATEEERRLAEAAAAEEAGLFPTLEPKVTLTPEQEAAVRLFEELEAKKYEIWLEGEEKYMDLQSTFTEKRAELFERRDKRIIDISEAYWKDYDRREEAHLSSLERRREDFAFRETRIRADHLLRLSRMEEDYQRAVMQDATNHAKRLADLSTQFHKAAAQAQEDHQTKMHRMELDHVEKMNDLIRTRDARGLLLEMSRYARRRGEAEEDFGKAKRRRAEAYNDRVAQQNQQFADQKRRRARDYERQKQDEAANFKRAEERRAEDNARQEAQAIAAWEKANEVARIQRLDDIERIRDETDEDYEKLKDKFKADLDELDDYLDDRKGAEEEDFLERVEKQSGYNRTLEEQYGKHLNRLLRMTYQWLSEEQRLRTHVFGAGYEPPPDPRWITLPGETGAGSASRQMGGYTNFGQYLMHKGEFVLNPLTARIMESRLGGRLTQEAFTRQTGARRSISITLKQENWSFSGEFSAEAKAEVREMAAIGAHEALDQALEAVLEAR